MRNNSLPLICMPAAMDYLDPVDAIELVRVSENLSPMLGCADVSIFSLFLYELAYFCHELIIFYVEKSGEGGVWVTYSGSPDGT